MPSTSCVSLPWPTKPAGGQGDYQIQVDVDKEANTITISDNGIGMNRDEVIENLGTIAKSGTAAFLESLTGDEQKDSQLIGQFGVGFYSAFIVAERVEVHTRKAGEAADQGVLWESHGEAEFSIEARDKETRGTSITLFLKKDCEEFADDWRVRSVIKKYSDHISVPVMMVKPPHPRPRAKRAPRDRSSNTRRSMRPPPCGPRRARGQRRGVQGVLQARIPRLRGSPDLEPQQGRGQAGVHQPAVPAAKAPFDMWNREMSRGLKLYVQRTFIMDEAEQFLPMYLRFVKGVVDSNDLSLNVSREILQQDPAVDSMRSALTKRVLDMLAKLAKAEGDDYAAFWKEFGQVLKEGPAEDMANKEKIAKLLRFSTTHTDQEEQDQSLEDYVRACRKAGQDLLCGRGEFQYREEQPAPGGIPQEGYRGAAAV